MEYLEANLDWLKERVLTLQGISENPPNADRHSGGLLRAVRLPRPGGALHTPSQHGTGSCGDVALELQGRPHCVPGADPFSWPQLTVVHLVDCLHCQQPASYIAALLLSLTTMLQLHMPHINVLSKWDNLRETVCLLLLMN